MGEKRGEEIERRIKEEARGQGKNKRKRKREERK